MSSPSRSFLMPGLLAVATSCADVATDVHVEPRFHSFAESEWSEPVHLDAPINSPFRELGANLSPDELSLYFGSDRPDPSAVGAFDIWVSRRSCRECPWGAPANLGADINSPGGDGGPSVSPDGLLLFYSGSRTPSEGGEDIWVSRRTDPDDDLGWGPPVNLGPDVNTAGQEGGPVYVPALAAGGVNLYFTRNGDLYGARVTLDGAARGPAVPIALINHPTAVDDGLSVRADGREGFFWSTRPGMGGADIWVTTRQSPSHPWSPPENAGPVINTTSADLDPGLSWDGRTLLFSAAAAGRPGLGFQDIWMVTRAP